MEMHELVDKNGENTGKVITHVEARNLDSIPEEKIYCTDYYIKQDVDIDKCVLQKEEVEEVRYFKIDELETIDNEGIEWLENLIQFIK